MLMIFNSPNIPTDLLGRIGVEHEHTIGIESEKLDRG